MKKLLSCLVLYTAEFTTQESGDLRSQPEQILILRVSFIQTNGRPGISCPGILHLRGVLATRVGPYWRADGRSRTGRAVAGSDPTRVAVGSGSKRPR